MNKSRQGHETRLGQGPGMLHLTYLEQRKEKLSKLKTGALRHFGLKSVYFSTPKTRNL